MLAEHFAAPLPHGEASSAGGQEASWSEEEHREAHVPAQQPSTRQEARLPAPHVDPRRSGGAALPSAQGPPQAVGLIWRIRDRRTFLELRRSGRRVRSGVLSVTFCLPRSPGCSRRPAQSGVRRSLADSDRPSIATGSAVVSGPRSPSCRAGPLPRCSGAYLFTVRPEALTRTFAQLTQDLEHGSTSFRRRLSAGGRAMTAAGRS